MGNDEIIVICFAFILILVLISIISWTIYDSIRYYWLKPKFRINSETHIVEYWHPHHHCWWSVCGWDSKNSDRIIVLHQTSGNEVNIKYNGPGRYVHKIEEKLTQKQLRERFPYDNTKELHEQQVKYINNEDIITSKILHEKFK